MGIVYSVHINVSTFYTVKKQWKNLKELVANVIRCKTNGLTELSVLTISSHISLYIRKHFLIFDIAPNGF